ncbi:MAG: hypothetical protein GF353_07450 [Candidatus Lokiarchaeota archaeon]|nr:hypothetical protein [Candidatus Lokiarchaeota archaeon]
MKTHLFYPGGNPTALIENLDNQISRNDYPKISRDILKNQKNIEQVGFIEIGKNGNYRCQMMGDEFCINSLRSLGLWIYGKFGKKQFEIESSGTTATFKMEVENWIAINLSKKYSIKQPEKNLKFIELEGICHFVQEIKKSDWSKEKFKKLFKEILKKYSFLTKDNPAIGLISVDENNKIYPLVYVKETDSLIFESACGSGTLAAFIADKSKNRFTQPSNHLYIVEENQNGFTLKSIVSKI